MYKKFILSVLFVLASLASGAFLSQQTAPHASVDLSTSTLPKELDEWIAKKHPLLTYVDAFYSPLGRSPAVDAVLSDPYYLPSYARQISKAFHAQSQKISAYQIYTTMLKASGMALAFKEEDFIWIDPIDTPPLFTDCWGFEEGHTLYALWLTFKSLYREVEDLLTPLSFEDRQWIRQHYGSFFFGPDGNYDFFTTDSPMPLRFFELASRIDLVKLAEVAQKTCLLIDYLYEFSSIFKNALEKDFHWEEEGLSFDIWVRSHTLYRKAGDLTISLGRDNVFETNVGGTFGERPLSLFVDKGGYNIYKGENFVQGTGFLGVGVLANFVGHSTYQALSYSQGTGFFGVGLLLDWGGYSHYELDFGGQSFATFGSSLLWSRQGHSHYLSHQGMAQGASSTRGIAFLVDGGGFNTFTSADEIHRSRPYSGIGQGASIGIRSDRWDCEPSFYGGLSFLYSKGGHNTFETSWFGQGSAYFLGLGILADEGGNDQFYATVDSQGQGLHQAAGLLLRTGKGTNTYKGGWGSMGVAGDRSVGMLIDIGGKDTYEGTTQSLGTSRKPKALSLFIDIGEEDIYLFQGSSNANIQWPASPLEWSKALFIDLGSHSVYAQNVDEMARSMNHDWGVFPYSKGISRQMSLEDLEEELFTKFPSFPRFEPFLESKEGWASRYAYRPLQRFESNQDVVKAVQELFSADYDKRRFLYESLDLFRFLNKTQSIDLTAVFNHLGSIPEDLFSYATLWAIQNKKQEAVDPVLLALEKQSLRSAYARRMAIKLVGKLNPRQGIDILSRTAEQDPDLENRARAAYYASQAVQEGQLDLLRPLLNSPFEAVRYEAARGLKDRCMSGVMDLVEPLLADSSFYVRRSAAIVALSCHDKRGIETLLATLQFETLDTQDNYGDNLYQTLAHYTGVNFGLDKEKWLHWWQQNRETFDFLKTPSKN